MISIAELKRIAAKNKVALSVIEKDYALTWILYALAKSKFQKRFVFKGGTALRKIYFPDWRYSEDLDFTITKPFSGEELKEVIKTINDYLAKTMGITIVLKSLHMNPEYAQLKIQFLGPLHHENTIKFDLSFNELLVLPPEKKLIFSEYSDQERHFLLVYPLEEILAEKIRSILQRGKTRDYYDVWKILKLHFNKINAKRTQEVLSKKCQFKNIVCNEELLFETDKIAAAQEHWEKGLAHQISDLPSFKTVVDECKTLLSKFL